MRAKAVLTFFSAWIASSPVLAETSTALVKNGVRDQYHLMQRIVAAEYPQPSNIPKPDPTESYDLVSCVGTWGQFWSSDRFSWKVASLAAEVDFASRTLDWIGYPKTLWETSLADYERAKLDYLAAGREDENVIAQSVTESLVRRLNEYGKASSPRLAVVTWETRCGGSGTSLKLV